MKNKKQLKWYHYTAKVIVLTFFSLVFPIFAIMSMSSGDSPFWIYKSIWNEGRD